MNLQFCTGEEARKFYEEAMTIGYIESALTILILVGVMGSGKSLFKRLVLGLSAPEFSASTPLAESSVRSMSICQVAVDGQGPVEWRIVTPSDIIDVVARKVLELPWKKEVKQRALDYVTDYDEEANVERKHIPMLLEPDEESNEVQQPDRSKIGFLNALEMVKVDQELLQRMSTFSGRMKLMEIAFVYILDSGGQPPFREMFPHFVHESSAFVLMQKLNERLDFKPPIKYREEGKEDSAQYTSQLTNEQTLHQYFQAVQSHNCRVFVVGTHRDLEHKCEAESREEKNGRLLEAFRPVLGNRIVLYKAGDPDQLMFPVDSTSRKPEDQATAQAFREAIMKLCLGKRVKIPLPWFILEQLLRQLAEKMKEKVLSLEECYEVANKKLHMPDKLCKAAIEYLGKLNIFFYHPSILPQVVFSDVQVILDKLKELVHCSHELKSNTAQSLPQNWQSGEWLEFRDFAQIDSTILGKFPSYYRDGLFTVPQFLELLEDLLIAGKLANGKHFMPSILPDLALEEVAQQRVTSAKHPSPIAIYYTMNSSRIWLPVGVVPSLVVHLQNHYKWKPVLHGGKPACMYHNCMQFELPGEMPGRVTLIDSIKFLEIHVKASLEVASEVCPNIRSMVLSGLKEAHKSLHYDSPVVEDGVLCSGECGNKEAHLGTITKDRKWWKCSENADIGDILDRERQTVWFPYTRINPPIIQGANIIAQTEATILPGQPLTYHWKEHGFEMHIPAGALCDDETPVTVSIQASLKGDYQFPDNRVLVSGVYWIALHPPVKFHQKVTVSIQHCGSDDDPALSFVTAKCTQKSRPFTFEYLSGGSFSDSGIGTIEVNHFSVFAAIGQRKSQYTIHAYYIPKELNVCEAHITVTTLLNLTIEVEFMSVVCHISLSHYMSLYMHYNMYKIYASQKLSK